MGQHLGTHKDVEKLARKARKAGWRVEVTSSNHLRWTPPEGDFIISGLTASSGGTTALKQKLRKAGLGA